jgi:hypothetical protein
MATHVGDLLNSRRTSADNRWMSIQTGTYVFSGFYDDTHLYVNGRYNTTISKQATTSVSLTANDIISSGKPLSFALSGQGLMGICYAFDGTLFAHEWDRYNIRYYIVATEESANVTVTHFTTSTSTQVFSGSVSTTAFTNINPATTSFGRYIIESDAPIAVYAGELPSSDCTPLYPCAYEIYGTASGGGHIIATEDGTTVVEYDMAGNSTTTSMDRGDYKACAYTGGTQFTGNPTKIVGDKPIAAFSQADADGGEMTPFIDKAGFATQFVVPEDEREFTKFVSDQAATIEAYDSSGTLLSTTTMTGNATNALYTARLTGTSSYENVLYITDLPVTAIYEGENDDETILAAHLPKNMQVNYGPRVTTSNLLLSLDASNPKSYSGSGSTWTDLMGNYDATLSSFTYTADGDKSYFRFSGTGRAATSAITQPTNNQMTMEVVYMSSSTDTFDTYGRIADIGDSTISLGTGNNYQLRMWVYAGGVRSAESYKDGIGQDGLWHHVVFTYTGTGTAFYLDGEYVMGDSDHTGSLTQPNSFVLGYDAVSASYPFGGRIALARLYDVGLTAEEARNNFNALRGRFGI